MLMEEMVLDDAMSERSPADQPWCKYACDNFQGCISVCHGTGFTQAIETGIGRDTDPGTLSLAPIDMKGFDARNMQDDLSRANRES